MEMASLQQILDAKLHLGPVEGLGKKVMGAVRERLLLGLRRVVAGEHQNRQIIVLRDHGGQLIHGGQTVDVRHMEIQQDQVGPGTPGMLRGDCASRLGR